MKQKYEPHHAVRYLSTDADTHTKELPALYKEREECCGCGACMAVCPAGAIEMLPDEEGFLYPAEHADKCVRCYQCLGICAFKADQKEARSHHA